jgi:hypothetical protein
MSSKSITQYLGNDFLAASSAHDKATIQGIRTGADVSTMRWDAELREWFCTITAFDEDVEPQPLGFPSFDDDSEVDDEDEQDDEAPALPCECEDLGLAQCRCKLILPDPEVDDEDEQDDRPYQDWLARASRLDLADVVARTCESIAGKDGTPMQHLLEAWQANPPDDLSRICIAPHVADGIGKWLAIQLARQFSRAMAAEGPF